MRWQHETHAERRARNDIEYTECLKAREAQAAAVQEWQRVFAWRPRYTLDGGIKMWWEYILRRSRGKRDDGWFGRQRYRWEYRPITIIEQDVRPYGD